MKLSEVDPLFWVAVAELMEQGYEFEFKLTFEIDRYYINHNILQI